MTPKKEPEKQSSIRPSTLKGVTHKYSLGCGNLYITVNFKENKKPFEIFTKLGKSGSCISASLEALTRSISIGLQNDVTAATYVTALTRIQCDQGAYNGGKRITSCADAIAEVFREFK